MSKSQRGMGRVYKRGRLFWAQFNVRGVTHRISTKSALEEDAVKFLKRKIADIENGKAVGSQIEKTDFETLANILLDNYRANRRKSIKRAEFALKPLREVFGKWRAKDITSDAATKYAVKRQAQGRANATINFELAMLRHAFTLAKRAGKVAGVPEIDMLKVSNARQGFFEREQLEGVLERLPLYLRPVVRTAFITGWRCRSEILSRQWRHVDFENGWLRLEVGEGKTGQGRMFPLTAELRALLESQRAYVSALEKRLGRVIPHIFVYPNGAPIRIAVRRRSCINIPGHPALRQARRHA